MFPRTIGKSVILRVHAKFLEREVSLIWLRVATPTARRLDHKEVKGIFSLSMQSPVLL